MQLKWWIWAIIFLVIILFCGIGIWFFRTWKFAKIISRLIPALVEPNPFYALLELLTGSSHAMERHSPMTQIGEQIKRARTGITPEGIKGKMVNSGRWISHYPMLQAIEFCRNKWEQDGGKNKKVFVVNFDREIGDVVLVGTKKIISTKRARIIVNKKGEVVTAFPILEDLNDSEKIINLVWIEK